MWTYPGGDLVRSDDYDRAKGQHYRAQRCSDTGERFAEVTKCAA